MTTLQIYKENGAAVGGAMVDFKQIASTLGEKGVLLERWEANAPLSADAGQEEVLTAYKDSIERLNKSYGFQSIDVVALRPDNPKKDEMRQKFLSEHTHADFEVRFFVDGMGLFYLHVGDQVYLVLCERGDLISVPADTTHWFDMGTSPNFKCIRLFTTPDGWVGNFTGNDIATHLPDFDTIVKAVA